MNTATQLLERALSRAKLSIFPLDAKLADDIEAYLAKQQVEQEPVGWYAAGLGDFSFEKPDDFDSTQTTGIQWQPLYTAPQAREPMSEVEIESVWRAVEASDFRDCVVPFARAIEAKLGVKP